jgi:LacI family transcriptional regulator
MFANRQSILHDGAMDSAAEGQEAAHWAKPATLKDIAAELGVAVSTVSRALSNPERVSPAMRDRVLSLAQRLNYVPSAQARALSSGRTGTVALVVPDITNPFFFGIIRGTQRMLRLSGYSHVLVDTEESSDLEHAALTQLQNSTDGVILSASRLGDSELIGWSRTMPLVAVNRQTPGVANVWIDTPSGVAQAVEHLASLNHRRIAYVSGPSHSTSNALRLKAMEATARRLGMEVVVLGPFPPARSFGAVAADAAINARVTACIAFNDLIAIGILQRMKQRGLRVPQDLSVVGCDDIFGAEFCDPALTTITAPIERAGAAATSMLLAAIRGRSSGPQPVESTLSTHLTVRESTGVREGASVSA